MGKKNVSENTDVARLLKQTILPFTKQKPSAKIVFWFDDGDRVIYDWIYPQFASRDIVGIASVYTDNIGASDERATGMTENEIKEMYTSGWEIASETKSHAHLSSISLAEAEIELKGSYDILVAMGVNPTTLTVPFGEYNEDVLEIASKYYRAASAGDYASNYPPFRTMALNREDLDVYSLSTIEDIIDEAVSNDALLILRGHPQNWDETRKSIFLSAIDYAIASGAEITTLYEALNEDGNILEFGVWDNFFRIGTNGAISASNLNFKKQVNLLSSTPIGSFPNNSISIDPWSGGAGSTEFPSVSGVLYTLRFTDRNPEYQYQRQVWQDRVSPGMLFLRTWNAVSESWDEWETVGVLSQSFAAHTSSSDISNFHNKTLSFEPSNATGYPTASGMLLTFKTAHEAYHRQLWSPRTDMTTLYIRRWNETTDSWDSWVQIAGGASGSFTSADGKTITVVNGRITAIV